MDQNILVCLARVCAGEILDIGKVVQFGAKGDPRPSYIKEQNRCTNVRVEE